MGGGDVGGARGRSLSGRGLNESTHVLDGLGLGVRKPLLA